MMLTFDLRFHNFSNQLQFGVCVRGGVFVCVRVRARGVVAVHDGAGKWNGTDLYTRQSHTYTHTIVRYIVFFLQFCSF